MNYFRVHFTVWIISGYTSLCELFQGTLHCVNYLRVHFTELFQSTLHCVNYLRVHFTVWIIWGYTSLCELFQGTLHCVNYFRVHFTVWIISGYARAPDAAPGGGPLRDRPHVRWGLPPDLPHISQQPPRPGQQAVRVVRAAHPALKGNSITSWQYRPTRLAAKPSLLPTVLSASLNNNSLPSL